MSLSNSLRDYDGSASSLETNISPSFKVLEYEPRVLLDDVEGLWDEGVTKKLQSLVRLPPGWDGYQAMPVTFTNAAFALQMLAKVCGPDDPAPTIVPGIEGDLQLEWHTAKGDIELHVLAPNVVHAWFAKSNSDNPDGEEKNLKNDFSIVAQWVRDIAEQHAAP